MNTLPGQIASVKTDGSLSLVKVKVGEALFSVILIDTPDTAPYLQAERAVEVIFKETEVVLGTGELPQVSLQNRLHGQVLEVEAGLLLGRVRMKTVVGEVVSIVTARAIEQLGIEVGKEIWALVKTNEVMLAPVAE